MDSHWHAIMASFWDRSQLYPIYSYDIRSLPATSAPPLSWAITRISYSYRDITITYCMPNNACDKAKVLHYLDVREYLWFSVNSLEGDHLQLHNTSMSNSFHDCVLLILDKLQPLDSSDHQIVCINFSAIIILLQVRTDTPGSNVLLQANGLQYGTSDNINFHPNRALTGLAIVGLPKTRGHLHVTVDSQISFQTLILTIPFELAHCPLGLLPPTTPDAAQVQ